MCLHELDYPNKSSLLSYLKKYDIKVSAKTIERDLDYLKYSLHLDFEYDRRKRGYYFNTESQGADGIARFLELSYLAENVNQSDFAKYISYAETDLFKGIEYVPILLDAIDKQRIIEFNHQSYQRASNKIVTIEPYHLREYMNRWYVIGYKTDTRELRSFGLDRISNLSLSNVHFKKDTSINIKSLFMNAIGMIYDDGSLMEIEFKIPISQKNYFESLPLHKTQIHLSDINGEAYYQIRVINNYELEQKLLMHSRHLTLTKPKTLVDTFTKIVNDIHKRYS